MWYKTKRPLHFWSWFYFYFSYIFLGRLHSATIQCYFLSQISSAKIQGVSKYIISKIRSKSTVNESRGCESLLIHVSEHCSTLNSSYWRVPISLQCRFLPLHLETSFVARSIAMPVSSWRFLCRRMTFATIFTLSLWSGVNSRPLVS